jgi:DUF4097 and DUF4098 domain-containing protein YvlB
MQQTYDTPGQVTVVLQLGIGDIDVRTADTTQTSIEITNYDKTTPPHVSCDAAPDGGYRVTIEHRAKRTWGFSFGRGLAIELVVPTGTRISGSSGSAELEIRGTLGSLDFRTGAGDISFDEITGDVQISCASGDVDGRSIGGHLAFKGASGDIDVGSVGGGALVRSASGDIQIDHLEGPTTITVGSGDIDLRQVGAGSVNVRAIAGDVHVGVREGMGVWLDISSTGGDVHSGLDAAARDEHADEPQLELTVNTVSGDIDVSRVAARR